MLETQTRDTQEVTLVDSIATENILNNEIYRQINLLLVNLHIDFRHNIIYDF